MHFLVRAYTAALITFGLLLVLSACSTPTQYTLTFGSGGADGEAPASVTSRAGAFILLPDATSLTRGESEFLGWTDDSGTLLLAGTYFKMPASDVTLEAAWTFTLSFLDDAGETSEAAPASRQVAAGNAVRIPGPGDLTNAPWSFLGWSDEGTIHPEGAFFEMPASDVALTAAWSNLNAFTLTFTAPGSDVTGSAPEAMRIVAGSTITLPAAPNLTRGSWTFTGWSDGTRAYDVGDTFVMPLEDTTLTARWSDATVERMITFAAGAGATGTPPAALKGTPGSIVTLPEQGDLKREAYAFDGWNDGSADYPGGARYVVPNQDVTLTAQWTEIDAGTLFTLGVDLFQAGDNASVATVFANDDDLPDVMVVGENADEGDTVFAVLYFNMGNGTFSASDQSDFGDDSDAEFVGVDDAWIAVADVDGDGDEDMFIVGDPDRDVEMDGSENSVSAILYLNDGTGNFERDARSDYGDDTVSVTDRVSSATDGEAFVGVEMAWAEFADLDGDGDLDLLTSGEANEDVNNRFYSLLLYVNDGDGNFELSDQSFKPDETRSDTTEELSRTDGFVAGMYDSSFAAVDIDGDEDLDLIVPGMVAFDDGSGRDSSNESLMIYRNETFTSYAPVFELDPQSSVEDADLENILSLSTTDLRPVGKQRSTTLTGDVDGDGDVDLFVTGESDGAPSASLYLNDGTGSIILSDQSSGEANEVFGGLNDSASLMFDVDLDGDLDILTMGYDGSANSGYAYLNDGSGNFTRSSLGLFPLQDGTFVATDLDADGDVDIVQIGEVENGDSYRTVVYWNQTIRER